MHKIKKYIKLRVDIIIVILVMSFGLSGCTPDPIAQPAPILANTLESIETATMAPVEPSLAAATATQTPESTIEPADSKRTAYQFNVDLDYNKHTLDVRQTIQYQNQSGQELYEIKLAVPSNAKSNVFILTSLDMSGDVGLTDYSLDGVSLTIHLDNPLVMDGHVTISIDYTLSPRLQGGILGYTAKQLNLSDWYPFVPPYDAENGWIIHQPAEVGEYLVYDVADFDLTLNLIEPEGLVIAGSTEAAPLDLDSYSMEQENARNITFSVSDQYTVLTNTSSGVTVRGYVFEGDAISGQAAVDYTASALQLYTELFGLPYPYQSLSVVESDFQDGMEYDGLYYLSDFYFNNYDGTFQNYLALLSVHETSHQWWFGMVANDQALEPWLDESLATYSEYLYIERYFPELTNWWWDYRIAAYKPSGRVNLTIYDQSDLRVYINAVYLRGAVFLDQLRQTLGDDAFFAGLRTYTNTYNHKIARWDDFIMIMAPDPTDAVKKIFNDIFK